MGLKLLQWQEILLTSDYGRKSLVPHPRPFPSLLSSAVFVIFYESFLLVHLAPGSLFYLCHSVSWEMVGLPETLVSKKRACCYVCVRECVCVSVELLQLRLLIDCWSPGTKIWSLKIGMRRSSHCDVETNSLRQIFSTYEIKCYLLFPSSLSMSEGWMFKTWQSYILSSRSAAPYSVSLNTQIFTRHVREVSVYNWMATGPEPWRHP